MDSPFRIEVYDKAFRRLGFIGDPAVVRFVPRHNALDTVELVLDSDHRRSAQLAADGARLVVTYAGQVISGPVRAVAGDPQRTTYRVDGDWRLLTRILGWPVPGAPLSAQTAAYDTRTGPAETVVKGVIAANAARLGLPVTIAPDLGRGAVISTTFRMHPLADRLFPLVDQAGIGITVVQVNDGLLVDCYTPREYPRTLTAASGVVVDWQLDRSGPTATRVVLGDQGQAEARSFTQFVSTAREGEWGDVVEVFRDARDTDDPAVVQGRAAETLGDGRARSGLSLQLAETKHFRYGQDLHVGDRVTVEISPGVVVTDVLREATVAFSERDGLLVTPEIGERRADPNRTVARLLGQVLRSIRDNQAGR